MEGANPFPHCKLFEVEKFDDFHWSIGSCKTFQVK